MEDHQYTKENGSSINILRRLNRRFNILLIFTVIKIYFMQNLTEAFLLHPFQYRYLSEISNVFPGALLSFRKRKVARTYILLYLWIIFFFYVKEYIYQKMHTRTIYFSNKKVILLCFWKYIQSSGSNITARRLTVQEKTVNFSTYSFTYTEYQKETAEISRERNEETVFTKFGTHRTRCAEECSNLST